MNSRAKGWRLIADVGGTNVRFGQAENGRVLPTSWGVPVENFSSFDSAVANYMDRIGPALAATCCEAAIAAAGPVGGPQRDTINVTNNDWSVSPDAVAEGLGRRIPAQIINDLEAVAHALPSLRDTDLDAMDDVSAHGNGGSAGALPTRRLAVNVGTGFGSALLITTPTATICCPAESGHMLRRLDSGDAGTVEDYLSGRGVRELAAKQAAPGHSSAHLPISIDADSPEAIDVRKAFATMLARTAANLVLATSAWDGVYLCGSVATAWFQVGDHEAFRRCFNGTGPMADRLAATPIALITHDLPAFIGLARIDV